MIDDNVDGGRLEAAAKGGVGSKEEMGLRENRGPVGYARRHRPERKVGRGDLKRQEARERHFMEGGMKAKNCGSSARERGMGSGELSSPVQQRKEWLSG